MVTSLTKPPALLIRDLLVSHWTPGNTAGFDPSITDPTDAKFLPISRGWYGVGQSGADPHVSLTNFGEGVIGGGQTGISAVKGDGSGVAQNRSGTGRATVFAEREQDYNDESAADVVDLIRTEIERIALANPTPGTLAYWSTDWGGASTDTDVTPAVEMSAVSISYGYVRD